MKTIKHIHLFCRNKDGAAMIELALVGLILVPLFLGVVEISNYVYAKQKLQSAAETIAMIKNKVQTNCATDLRSIAHILPNIVEPFNPDVYTVIYTYIRRDRLPATDPPPEYSVWQFRRGSYGAPFHTHTNGGSNASNRVPSGALGTFTFNPGDEVLVVETYMRYQSVLSASFANTLLGLRNSMIYYRNPPSRPRTGTNQFGPDDCGNI